MTLKKRGLDLLATAEAHLAKSANNKPSVSPTPFQTPVGMLADAGNKSIRAQLEKAETMAAEKAAEVELLKSSHPIRFLDPKRVRASKYADRHPTAYADAKFQALCESIRETKGNTQPGVVRPITGDPDFDFEISSGHRRHMACSLGGFQFRAEVREMSDDELVRQMLVENTAREDLSAFERGKHFASLIRNGLYRTTRELSAKTGISQSTVVKLMKFDDLPDLIVEAFPNPREIRNQWVDPMLAAWKADSSKVKREIALIKADHRPAAIFKRLSGQQDKKSVIASEGKIMGRIRMIHGCPALVLFKDAPDELIAELTKIVETWATKIGETT